MSKKKTEEQESKSAGETDKLGNEVDVSQLDLVKLGKAVAENPGLMEFAHSISSANIAPLEESQIRARSYQAMIEQIDIQKDQIYEQLKLLAKQVKKLNERRVVSEEVYQAKMTFEPVVGRTYFLYEKEDGKVLSMVGPNEWGRSKNKLVFLAQVTLLGDRTWKIDRRAGEEEDEES